MEYIILLVVLVLPFVLTVLNIINFFKEKKIAEMWVNLIILLLGMYLTINYIFLCEIDIFKNLFAMKLFLCSAVAGFMGILGICVEDYYSQLKTVVCIDFIFIGIVVSLVYLFQIHNYILKENMFFKGDGIYFILFPINYILLGIRLTKENISRNIINNYIIPKNKFQMKFISFMTSKFRIIILNIFVILIAITILFIIAEYSIDVLEFLLRL